jgi:hypothetical protein
MLLKSLGSTETVQPRGMIMDHVQDQLMQTEN